MSLLNGHLHGRQIHFVGIGGIGMSGLAQLCTARGLTVSGCDVRDGAMQQVLRCQGIPVAIGHHPKHLTADVGLVVYSQAVSGQQAELLNAQTRGLATISRGQLLAELSSTTRLIGVAGAHGKTTTSGMSAQLLIDAGWDPTVMVGGRMLSLGTNARHGRGRFMVTETDESDGSFLLLSPEIAIVTNIDREHLNHYGTFENLIAAFQRFVRQLGPRGVLIRCEDDPITRQALTHPNLIAYGRHPHAMVRVTSMRRSGMGSEFRVEYRTHSLGTFRLQVPGEQNMLNALAVISLGLTLELPLETIRQALWAFRGTSRRFQVTTLPNDIVLVDDYAHHPSEIRATLAADPWPARHRVVVFQPHRFSRTKLLEDDFAACFDRADGLIVTDIYAASEAPIPQVSGHRLAELIRSRGHRWVRYVPRKELVGFLRPFVQPHDTVFFLGAGDITDCCHELATSLRPS